MYITMLPNVIISTYDKLNNRMAFDDDHINF